MERGAADLFPPRARSYFLGPPMQRGQSTGNFFVIDSSSGELLRDPNPPSGGRAVPSDLP
jgi:hypothetical protein